MNTDATSPADTDVTGRSLFEPPRYSIASGKRKMRYNSNTCRNILPQGVGAATRPAGFRREATGRTDPNETVWAVADDFTTADKISSRAPAMPWSWSDMRRRALAAASRDVALKMTSAQTAKAGQRCARRGPLSCPLRSMPSPNICRSRTIISTPAWTNAAGLSPSKS
jgi:hypothetical protein